jgi:DNA-formamidopyrimidine glycosylase
MPELPEVETIRRDLEKEVQGKRIKSVDVSGLRSIRRHTNKKQFTSRLEGKKIESVGRRGKNLMVDLGDDLLVVHLGMSGQLLKAAPKDPAIKHTHVVFNLSPGGQLRYVDTRTFGELYVVSKAAMAEEAPELTELGFDPVAVFSSILAVFAHQSQGSQAGIRVFKGQVVGAFAFAVFFMIVGSSVVPVGIPVTYIAATAAALIVSVPLHFFMRRSVHIA